jgi:hypothetical protein
MKKNILVPLGQYDRSEDMVPYVESVARPGMKVVFLVRYPVDGIRWQKEAYGMRAALKAKQLARHYSWEENLARAKAQVAPACEALRVKGIESTVEVYAGNLRKAARAHAINGDVHLIMTRAGICQRIASFLSGSDSLLDLLAPSKSPVLLTHPGTAA